MIRFLAIAVFITVLVAAASQTLAEPACKKRTEVMDYLANKFSEHPVAIGLASNGGVIEVLSSVEGTSWTIIISMPDGTACMIAAGENWEAVEPSIQPVEGNGT